ncbi:hypothetical protein Tco_0856980 [Tanacetum coccineum]|uniref:PB1-like domain-containing protein n=1 Tax=Tanacetum coccineum TaxID=301880 RepID=A0ABQ5B5Z6_9ASTR
MVKLSFDLNVRKDSSDTNEAAQNSLNIVHFGVYLKFLLFREGTIFVNVTWSFVDGHVSSVNVVDIEEFCLHDLKDMIVKLGYGVANLMYYHVLIPRLGLDYGLYLLNVDADVLKMTKYVKENKIILVYVEHESINVYLSIFVTPKNGVAIAVDNHLRNALIEIDSSPDVNRNLTPMLLI